MSIAAAVILIGAAALAVVVVWKLFFSGEVVGKVKGPRNNLDAANNVTIIVTRRASKSGTAPSIQLHASVLMASSTFGVTGAEAQRLADALDKCVEAGEGVDAIRGVQVEPIPGVNGQRFVGVVLAVGAANASSRACLTGGDARKLAQYLRIAATPGSTVQRAKWNLEKKKPS